MFDTGPLSMVDEHLDTPLAHQANEHHVVILQSMSEGNFF